MPDQLVRALLDPPRVRVVAALTTDTVREAARRHGTVGAATVALGRALTSGVLLATLTKGDERVSLQIAGDGPIAQISVDANDEGDVRGYLAPHGVAAALGKQPRPQVATAIGRGQVLVMRDLGLKEQYRGAASIVTGEIDEDVDAILANHLRRRLVGNAGDPPPLIGVALKHARHRVVIFGVVVTKNLKLRVIVLAQK